LPITVLAPRLHPSLRDFSVLAATVFSYDRKHILHHQFVRCLSKLNRGALENTAACRDSCSELFVNLDVTREPRNVVNDHNRLKATHLVDEFEHRFHAWAIRNSA